MERSGLKDYRGPTFRLVREIDWVELVRTRRFGARNEPLLVKGAVKAWPAWERWSFEELSRLRRPDGSEVVFRFQNGLVEQGVTRPPLDLAISPYIRDLGEAAARESREEGGLLPIDRYRGLDLGWTFHLDLSHIETFKPDRVYLAQWNILSDFPKLRKDFAISTLWPGWRHTW